MKIYSKMKDSGIEWIGKIPEHWDIVRLRFLAKITTGNRNTEDNEKDGQFPFFVRSQKIEKISTYTYDEEAVLTAGDGVGVGKVFHYVNGKFDVHQRVYKISDFKKILGKYFYYYIKENFGKEIFKGTAKSTVDSLRLHMIQNFPLVFGSILEQKMIISFLESKISKIDSELQNNQKLIELLKEKKQTTINQAVTKGLDPAVSMKDSGVEWIEKIPEHWDVNKIKFSAYVKGRIGWQGLRSTELVDKGPYLITGTDFRNGSIDWKKCYHVTRKRYEQDPHIQIKNHDLLITKDGTIGKLAYIEYMPDVATLNSHLLVIRPLHKKFTNRYMYWLFQTNQFDYYTNLTQRGTTFNALSQEMIENFIYSNPPLDEQKKISTFLDDYTSKIDSVILKTKNQIQKLQEFRKSLISSTVTGKIDVREAVT